MIRTKKDQYFRVLNKAPNQTGFLMRFFPNHQRSDHIIRDAERSNWLYDMTS